MPEKPVLEIVTARNADALVKLALSRADSGDSWTLVTPRRHGARDLSVRLLDRRGSGWLGPRVMSLSALLDHYSSSLPGEFGLTFVQATEIVSAIVSQMSLEDLVSGWPQAAVSGTLPSAILDRVARFCFDLDATKVSAEKLRVLAEKEPVAALAARKRLLAAIYEKFSGVLQSAGFYPSSTRDRLAADQATEMMPPEGVERLFFVTADALYPNSPMSRLILSLARSSGPIRQLTVAVVTPASGSQSAWPAHGNDALVALLSALPHKFLDLGDHRTERPSALDAMSLDPCAFRLEPVAWDTSVRAVRLPTPDAEALWIAQDIRRRLSSVEQSLGMSDVAIVGRGLGSRSIGVVRALSDSGIEAVASSSQPVRSAPAVRALLSFFSLASAAPSPERLLPVVQSPYLKVPLSSVLLSEAAAVAAAPQTVDQWQRSLVLAGHGMTPTYDALPGFLAELAVRSPATASASERVRMLRAFLAEYGFEETAHDTPEYLKGDRTGALRLSRFDLDGLNAFVSAVDEWLRGRELASRAVDIVSATEWSDILDRLATSASIRLSTYSREAVHVLDPEQAAGRSFRVVYLTGMTDGRWPRREMEEARDWSDTERASLYMPSSAEFSARERLLFHMAAASATEALVLTWPAMNENDDPSVPSAFISSLGLRLAGFAPELRSLDDVQPVALELLSAAREARKGIYRPWLNSEEGSRARKSWIVSGLRSRVSSEGLSAIDHPALAAHAGFIPDSAMDLLGPSATFSPYELETYDRCHLKFFFARFVAPSRRDQAAGFRSMLQAALKAAYESISSSGLFVPSSPADLALALSLVPDAVSRGLAGMKALAGDASWMLDDLQASELVSRFISRDLERNMKISIGAMPGLSTSIVSLRSRMGGPDAPVLVARQDERWYLSDTVDRVEEISDARLAGSALSSKLSGLLVVREYDDAIYARKPLAYWRDLLEARNLSLPLSAYLAAQTLSRRVFSIGTMLPVGMADPSLLSVREARWNGQVLSLDRSKGLEDFDNPVETCIDAALDRSTKLVRSMRQGDFTPQPSRDCFACPYSSHCRASLRPPGSEYIPRHSLPMIVPHSSMPAPVPVEGIAS